MISCREQPYEMRLVPPSVGHACVWVGVGGATATGWCIHSCARLCVCARVCPLPCWVCSVSNTDDVDGAGPAVQRAGKLAACVLHYVDSNLLHYNKLSIAAALMTTVVYHRDGGTSTHNAAR